MNSKESISLSSSKKVVKRKVIFDEVGINVFALRLKELRKKH